MDTRRWKRETDLNKLALKLCEEAGEVAKAVNDRPRSKAQMRLEARHTKIIADRILEVLSARP